MCLTSPNCRRMGRDLFACWIGRQMDGKKGIRPAMRKNWVAELETAPDGEENVPPVLSRQNWGVSLRLDWRLHPV